MILTKERLTTAACRGQTAREVSNLYGVHVSSVVRAAKKYKITLANGHQPGIERPQKGYSVIDIKRLAENGFSAKEISLSLGLRYNQVRGCLQHYGITTYGREKLGAELRESYNRTFGGKHHEIYQTR